MSWMPNRFQRLSALAAEDARHEIAAFERDVPPPTAFVERWRERQQAGLSGWDLVPWFLQIYIDDSLAASLADEIALPPEWAHLHPKQG